MGHPSCIPLSSFAGTIFLCALSYFIKFKARLGPRVQILPLMMRLIGGADLSLVKTSTLLCGYLNPYSLSSRSRMPAMVLMMEDSPCYLAQSPPHRNVYSEGDLLGISEGVTNPNSGFPDNPSVTFIKLPPNPEGACVI